MRSHAHVTYLQQLERRVVAAQGGRHGVAASVLESLRPMERLAFLLMESGGLTPRGVAAVLGSSPRTARRLAADAAERLVVDPRIAESRGRCAATMLLPGYASGRLSPVGRMIVRSHLHHCGACKTTISRFADVQLAARELVLTERPRVLLAPSSGRRVTAA